MRPGQCLNFPSKDRRFRLGGFCMSAVGKLDVFGDFDENGQLVETPYRPQLAKRNSPKSVAKPVQYLVKPAPLPPNPAPLSRKPVAADLKLDRSRDILLTAFGKATLTDRYLMPGESFQDMFARVSCAYADDVGHAHPVQWWHQAWSAHLLLPQRRFGFAGRHCRHLE